MAFLAVCRAAMCRCTLILPRLSPISRGVTAVGGNQLHLLQHGRQAQLQHLRPQGRAPRRRWMGGQSVVPWELALFVLDEMRAEGLTPSKQILRRALRSCRDGGAMKYRESMVNDLEEELEHLEDEGVEMCEDLSPGDWAGASELLQEMLLQDIPPTKGVLYVALEACAAGAHWEEALGLIPEVSMAEEFNEEGHFSGLEASIEECVMARPPRWEEALDMLKGGSEMTGDGVMAGQA
ncbi:unnamed protein product [Chrysoparadoxa australica]